ncbi:TPA: cyclopropane-fatty-acyl-phospholipid synthase family protein [Yersinia enterocolitica]
MNNEPENYQDILTRAFNQHYNTETDVWTQDIGMRILPLLVKGKLRFGPETRLLDIGCGSGEDIPIYCALCKEVIGIDIYAHPQWETLSTRYTNLNFHHGDFLSYEAEGQYRLVVDNGCFHHQDEANWLAWLTKIQQLLTKDGHFVLSTFCDDNQISYTDGYQRQHHYFSDKRLEELLSFAGFSVTDTIYIYRPKYANYYRISFCRRA